MRFRPCLHRYNVATKPSPDFANCVGSPSLSVRKALAGLRVVRVGRGRPPLHSWLSLDKARRVGSLQDALVADQ